MISSAAEKIGYGLRRLGGQSAKDAVKAQEKGRQLKDSATRSFKSAWNLLQSGPANTGKKGMTAAQASEIHDRKMVNSAIVSGEHFRKYLRNMAPAAKGAGKIALGGGAVATAYSAGKSSNTDK